MKKKIDPYDLCMKMMMAQISVEVGSTVIITLANHFAECDNLDDACGILDQIAGEEIESPN